MTEKPHEEMASFFDQRAAGYDRHMQESLVDAAAYYHRLAHPIPRTDTPIRILDLGCGTGLEIPAVLDAAPNAHLTCLDLSAEMLNQLQEKYGRHESLTLIRGSYLNTDLGDQKYDLVLSSMTLHHLLADQKSTLYQKVFHALKPGGRYIEGDYMVAPEKMHQLLQAYKNLPEHLQNGSHHIDIPLSPQLQTELLKNAGFINIRCIYEERENLILTANRPGEVQHA
jgi:tRNA (cmo5U34)-methyltransferase